MGRVQQRIVPGSTAMVWTEGMACPVTQQWWSQEWVLVDKSSEDSFVRLHETDSPRYRDLNRTSDWQFVLQ